MYTLYVISVLLHVLAAATWVGGMLFLVLVLVPVIRKPEQKESAGKLMHLTGVRFRYIGWVCLVLLVLSGAVNLALRGITPSEFFSTALWGTSFGRTLGMKLLLVAAILILSAIHDFRVGPAATAEWQANPGSAKAQRMRRQASWFGRLNLLLSLLVVLLAVMLVRGAPW